MELARRAARSGNRVRLLPAVAMSSEQVFRRYRGFDGVVWPDLEHPAFSTHDGLALVDDWPLVEEYARNLPRASECEAVALSWDDAANDGLAALGWLFVGYDVGYFESEWSHFSVILNELIFGPHEELRTFARMLNRHLLMDARDSAAPALHVRERLSAAGRDVELTPGIESIAVFVRQ